MEKLVQPISGQAIYVVLLRELKRYWRAKARVISSVAQSIFFLAIFGLGLGNFVGPVGEVNYLSFMAPGVIGMGLLFGSVFSGVSIIFDRQFGFMKEMMVAPVSRTSIIIGKILGGATTATIQGIILLIIASLMGAFTLSLAFVGNAFVTIWAMLLITAGFVGLGVAIGSSLNDFHAFQLLSTFVMWPLFMLSGVFFPIDAAPFILQVAMLADPMFYGVELLRWCLLGSASTILGPLGWLISLVVVIGFNSLMISLGTFLFSRTQI
ncbi:MAG: ABC transporter permease [Candidatus Bathyarchaeota archaeon]|nr:ABC transporter permease [Candidatus Bathyarchaeum tardum]WGM88588.1 MAG: ABC transporter permease [Candidatus Bathyarchaeum tardum]WNZ29156.1 MAG: ABC transporter permease [Candidatus Bathyarchaeota archaeon]